MEIVLDYSKLSQFNARNACKIAEAEYLKNPRDVHNLTRWGAALLKMYEKQKMHENHDQDPKIDDAISKLQEALSLDPCHHEALWCLGRAFSTLAPDIINNDKAIMDCQEKAAVCYQRAFELDPSNAIYCMTLILHSQRSTGTNESSPSSGTKVIRDNTDSMNFIWNYYKLSLLNAREACKISEAEYIKNPCDADNLTRWGCALIKMYEEEDQDSINDAISKLQEAISLDPSHHQALWCMGEALSTLAPDIMNDDKAVIECIEKAVVCYQRAFDLDPSNPIYHMNLASQTKLMYELGQQSTEATESSPSSETKSSELKYGLDQQSTGTTKSSPSSGTKDYSNVSLLNACNACKVAEAEYIKNPRDADNLTRWAGALIKMYEEQDRDSIYDLREAISLDPYHHQALWCLGEALTTLAPNIINNDKAILFCVEKAAVFYQRAFDLDPSNETYRKTLELHTKHLKGMYALDQQSTGKVEPSSSSGTKSLISNNYQSPRNTDLTHRDDSDSTNFVRDYYNLSLLKARNACKVAEAEYIKNPRDADNLTRWGCALIRLYEEGDQDSINDAISKLQEAISLDPCHHQALWCMGEALSALAPNIMNDGKAVIECIEKAVVCHQRAFDLDPSNEIYRESLEWTIEGLKEITVDQESTGTTKSSPSSGTTLEEVDFGILDTFNGMSL